MISTTPSPASSIKTLDQLPGLKLGPDPFGFVPLTEVVSKRIEWVWKPYIPRGALTIIAGDGGYGKSWMTCSIAADLSQGRALPGQDPIPPQKILMVGAEDGLSQVIKPKMELLGADMANIHASDKGFTLDANAMTHLVRYIEKYDVAIVFFDPLVVYLGGKIDMNRANETRPMLNLLGDVARDTNTAIVAVHHVRKSVEGATQHRVMGSADFVNGVRSTLMVDVSKGGQRYMAHVKSNWAANGPTLAYSFGSAGFQWQGEYSGRLDSVNEVSTTRRGEVEAWIKAALSAGPKLASEMLEEAEAAGYAERTLQRAKVGLVESYNTDHRWYWRLTKEVVEDMQRTDAAQDPSQPPASQAIEAIAGQIAPGLTAISPQQPGESALAYAKRVLDARKTPNGR